jgi:hypothetical protein
MHAQKTHHISQIETGKISMALRSFEETCQQWSNSKRFGDSIRERPFEASSCCPALDTNHCERTTNKPTTPAAFHPFFIEPQRFAAMALARVKSWHGQCIPDIR